MALTAANNVIQMTITSTDINGNTSWNRGAGNPTLNGTFGDGLINQNMAAGTVNVSTASAPFGTINNAYVKNNSGAGSGITITVQGKINGGALQTFAVLQPGGVWAVWQQAIAAASGITDLSLVIAGGTAAVEYFVGG